MSDPRPPTVQLGNVDAERSVLGSMLRLNAVIDEVLMLCREDDFTAFNYRLIFRAIVALHEKGKPADLVTVADWLKKQKLLGDVNYGDLAELWDASPTAAHAEYYARIVRDRSTLSSLHRAGQMIASEAINHTGPPDDVVEMAEKAIFAVGERSVESGIYTLAETLTIVARKIDEMQAAPLSLSGVGSGFPDLDDITAGLQDSELWIVAARPSVGKTSLGLALALQAARKGYPAMIASLEQSRAELGARLLTMESGIDGHRIRRSLLSADDMAQLATAMDSLSILPITLDDAAGIGMSRIAAAARRQKRRSVGLRLLVIDYLQLVIPDDRRAPRQEQVAGVARRMKDLAKELSIPVVAMAQLNRANEDRTDGRPRLSDLRESGEIEQSADGVILLHRKPWEDGVTPPAVDIIDCIVAKNRNGRIGDVTLGFRRSCVRFENYVLGMGEPFVTEDGELVGSR